MLLFLIENGTTKGALSPSLSIHSDVGGAPLLHSPLSLHRSCSRSVCVCVFIQASHSDPPSSSSLLALPPPFSIKYHNYVSFL